MKRTGLKRGHLSPNLQPKANHREIMGLSEFCVVLTTASDPVVVQRLIDEALGARLAACVQALPMQSHYRWKGKIEQAAETLLLFKAKSQDYQSLEALIRAHHDYETPEILQLPVTAGLPAYLSWLRAETL
jgi:periplasmic divalent cation tolerance protein